MKIISCSPNLGVYPAFIRFTSLLQTRRIFPSPPGPKLIRKKLNPLTSLLKIKIFSYILSSRWCNDSAREFIVSIWFGVNGSGPAGSLMCSEVNGWLFMIAIDSYMNVLKAELSSLVADWSRMDVGTLLTVQSCLPDTIHVTGSRRVHDEVIA